MLVCRILSLDDQVCPTEADQLVLGNTGGILGPNQRSDLLVSQLMNQRKADGLGYEVRFPDGGVPCVCGFERSDVVPNALYVGFNLTKTLINLIEAPINLIEAPINSLEAPINLIEAPINSLEAPINLIEAPINSLETLASELHKRLGPLDEPSKLVRQLK